MPTTLDSIVAATRQRLSQHRAARDLRALERVAARHTPRGFRSALHRASQNGIAVIAELKKASPSRGLIRSDFRPTELARDLEHAGAAALSVLTDEEFFQGSLANLRAASAATTLPCLRKDFILDPLQILEARANSADAILLIVAALTNKELRLLAANARIAGLDVLCEAHDEHELRRALDAGCDLIGINSRNLHTFEVNIDTAFRLVEKIPDNCLAVAESGISSGAGLARLRAVGYDAFLIGESLMKADRPGDALRELLAQPEQSARATKQERFGSKLEARSS
jgi:indole-3-glycerol phosphate synthase